MRRLLHIRICILLTTILPATMFGQELDVNLYRTIDGTFNNLRNPEWGSAGENLRLLVSQMGYSDGISAPSGINRPNPREISNTIFAQDLSDRDPLLLSDFTWSFGQFIDHDIGLTPDNEEEASIPVPTGDFHFDPRETGQATIAMHRNLFDPATGTSADNPRRHPNTITAYLDGSSVYGSDAERVDWLRTHEGGFLKMSAGNLLPFNTVNGEFEGEIDRDAPHMDDPVGLFPKQFVAGDPRANENPLLLGFHTLFAREHNRICNVLARENPDWGDEELFQYARKIVGGLIQVVVYNEWLPVMGVRLEPYEGYDPDINAQLFNSFTGAAFRVGHTLLSGNLNRVMRDGRDHPEGPVQLRRAFFNPLLVMEEGGIDVFLKGMGEQVQQSFDQLVVNDIRNFLFGPPGSPGLDLASININRGRERGLPDFNSIRVGLGLEPYQLFRNINSSNRITSNLFSLYRDVNEIDAWVGMLSETKQTTSNLFGETITTFMALQFRNLRDGDRFFFENDPVLSESDKASIRNTSLHDIIMRNTEIGLIQSEVFKAMPHEQICDNMIVDLSGRIWTEEGAPVSDVSIELLLTDGTLTELSSSEGTFLLKDVPGCFVKTMKAGKNKNDYQNGVTTFDMVLVQKHILRRQVLTSPYKLLAADVDMSGSITTLDLIKMRRIILSTALDFGGGPPWRFIPADYEFEDPSNPFSDNITSELNFDLLSKDTEKNYIAIKLGDLNGSALTTEGAVAPKIRSGGLVLLTEDRSFAKGETVDVLLNASQSGILEGLQFGIVSSPQWLRFIGASSNVLSGFDESNSGKLQNEIRLSWHDPSSRGVEISPEEPVLQLSFKANRQGMLSEAIRFAPSVMEAESYRSVGDPETLSLSIVGVEESVAGFFRMGQNQPNPFSEQTEIAFEVPSVTEVTLRITDIRGRILLERRKKVAAGKNQFVITADDNLPETGVFQYQIQTDQLALTRKMVRIQK